MMPVAYPNALRRDRTVRSKILARAVHLFLALSLTFSGGVFSSELDVAKMKGIANEAKAVRGTGENKYQIDNNPSNVDLEQAMEIYQLSKGRTYKFLGKTDPNGGNQDPYLASGQYEYELMIFVTSRLNMRMMARDMASLQTYLAEKHPNIMASAYFRGIVGGGKLTDMTRYLADLVKDIEPTPNISIDPDRFTQLGITMAPSVALVKLKGARDFEPILWVSGSVDPLYVLEQWKAGKKGNLGVVGDVTEIVERDLIEEMQERLAKIQPHMNDKLVKSLETYLDRNAYELPYATVTQTRRWKPEYRLTKDIVMPDGYVLGKAGDVINPLVNPVTRSVVAFHKAIIAFDSGNPKHVAFVGEAIKELESGGRIPLLVTTSFGPEGWENKAAIEAKFGYQVFLMNALFQERFGLQVVPSVVQAHGDELVIQEFAK